jgi:hypothetical protein
MFTKSQLRTACVLVYISYVHYHMEHRTMRVQRVHHLSTHKIMCVCSCINQVHTIIHVPDVLHIRVCITARRRISGKILTLGRFSIGQSAQGNSILSANLLSLYEQNVKIIMKHKPKQTPWPLVRKRTIPTERSPLVGEI